MITIRLQYLDDPSDHSSAVLHDEEIQVDEEQIYNASMIVVNGKYFHFFRVGGDFHTRPVFRECLPPVRVDRNIPS